jgi:hypothetical protein
MVIVRWQQERGRKATNPPANLYPMLALISFKSDLKVPRE